MVRRSATWVLGAIGTCAIAFVLGLPPVLAQMSMPWDVTQDGVVDIADVQQVGRRWFWTGTPGAVREDVTQDGVVDIGDIAAIGLHWMLRAATPEPTATSTSTASPSPTVTATATPTPSATAMVVASKTPTPKVTKTPTPKPTATSTPTSTPTSSPTPTPSPTSTPLPTPTATATPVPPAAPVVPGGTDTALGFSVDATQVEVGATLEVRVVLAARQPTRAVQFGLTWNPAVLRAGSIKPGVAFERWASANRASVVNTPRWELASARDALSAGALVLLGGPPASGVTGTDVVVSVPMTAIGTGTSALELTDARVVLAASTATTKRPDVGDAAVRVLESRSRP